VWSGCAVEPVRLVAARSIRGGRLALGCLEEASRFSGSQLVVGNRVPKWEESGHGPDGGFIAGADLWSIGSPQSVFKRGSCSQLGVAMYP